MLGQAAPFKHPRDIRGHVSEHQRATKTRKRLGDLGQCANARTREDLNPAK